MCSKHKNRCSLIISTLTHLSLDDQGSLVYKKVSAMKSAISQMNLPMIGISRTKHKSFSFVGDRVGLCVGETVGRLVGVSVGDKLGIADGDSLGAGDGRVDVPHTSSSPKVSPPRLPSGILALKRIILRSSVFSVNPKKPSLGVRLSETIAPLSK